MPKTNREYDVGEFVTIIGTQEDLEWQGIDYFIACSSKKYVVTEIINYERVYIQSVDQDFITWHIRTCDLSPYTICLQDIAQRRFNE